ncbi:DUF1294 domain-containing protein [Shewanella sp. AS1]|uniref:DUF1294 domain-containing protein n=1 Tax=Shewanella sp. AS1 TaxID=2907626 RepID=UPI001F3F44A5|nr:DUF1294 domain-containing protein [Shewanella sp. AS1]MCE9677892.1 DUF1294 domain-containing protein [Shewanella sp. AS1]
MMNKRATSTSNTRQHHWHQFWFNISISLKLIAIIGLTLGLLLACQQQRFPLALPVYYLAISLITWLAYYRDKRAARRGHWRTSENTLQLLSLLGGWPGALLAQHYLRHKSQKRAFRLGLYLMVLLNLGALVWLYGDTGQAALTWLSQVLD